MRPSELDSGPADDGRGYRRRPWLTRRIADGLGPPAEEQLDHLVSSHGGNKATQPAAERNNKRKPLSVLTKEDDRRERRVGRDLVSGALPAERAARILWTDAQWLKQHTDVAYIGLQYARAVLEDIREIIAAAAGGNEPADQKMLRRTIVALQGVNLKRRLSEAKVPADDIDEVEARITKDLRSLRDYGQPTPGSTALALVDDLIARIDTTLRRSDHPEFQTEARALMAQVQALAAEVSVELLAVYPAELLSGSHHLAVQLYSTAVSAAVLVVATGIRRGGSALWRQPDLAPHLRRAYDFVARQADRLAAQLQNFELAEPATESCRETIKRLAIALQYAMYGIMALIGSAEGWDGESQLDAGERLIQTCAGIVRAADGGSVNLKKHARASAKHLTRWLTTPWSNLVPGPLALRPEAKLSAVTRLAEALRVGDFHRWKRTRWD